MSNIQISDYRYFGSALLACLLLFSQISAAEISFSAYHSCSTQDDDLSCVVDKSIDQFFREHGPIPYSDPRFQGLLDDLTATHPDNPLPYRTQELGGNAIEVIDTAERSYEIWSEMIELARHHIHIQIFFIEDEVGNNRTSPVPCEGAPKVFERSEISCKIWQAAERGVQVRLITDNLGNAEFYVGGEKLVTAMATHPRIDVQNFNPTMAYHGARHRLWTDFKIWLWPQNLMHSKLMVVDGVHAISGGRNIGRNYMKPIPNDPPKGWGPRVYGLPEDPKYRDTDVYVRGPGVYEIQRSFLRNWLEFGEWEASISRNSRKWSLFKSNTWARNNDCVQQNYYGIPYYCKLNDTRFRHVKSPDQLLHDPEFFPELDRAGDDFLRFVDSLPARAGEIPLNPFLKPDNQGMLTRILASWLPIPSAPTAYQGLSIGERVYVAHIRNAKESIRLTNPYLALHQPIRNALLEAIVVRGVDVQIFTNSHQSSNPSILWDCSAQDFFSFLNNGARVFQFMSTTGMMHAKTAIFDQDVGIVGTINFDGVSFDTNSENLAIFRGFESVSQLEADWDRDLANEQTVELTLDGLFQSASERGLDQQLSNPICRNFGVIF